MLQAWGMCVKGTWGLTLGQREEEQAFPKKQALSPTVRGRW